ADPTRLAEADAILLCVPTPLRPDRSPDLTYVESSTRLVADVLRGGQLVVLESTSYPGTTRDVCGGILRHAAQAIALELGQHCFLAFSPEREDPGNATHTTRSIPRLVGGIDDASTAVAAALYRAAVDEVHEVESAEVAEAAKLLENVYRAVNIALVNELKPVLAKMGIDIWQVIEAAKTKPFGVQPFYPGPGLGGHCIPIDPFYLSWKAQQVGEQSQFIELAGEINSRMPARVVATIEHELGGLAGKRVLILGLAYKRNIDDVRESPAAEIISLLTAAQAEVSYHDPHLPVFEPMRKYSFDLRSAELTPATLQEADAVLIVTDHDAVDYEAVGEYARLVIDARNAMASVARPRARVVKA
ncbi:MAG: nucleotide sugar dehydrogenase, partial [Planctomycetota bacterium]